MFINPYHLLADVGILAGTNLTNFIQHFKSFHLEQKCHVR